MRLRIGGRIIPCTRVASPAAGKDGNAGSEQEIMAGFRATFRTGTGAKFIRVQALEANNHWRTIGWRLIWVTDKSTTSAAAKSTRTSDTFQSGLDSLWQSCRGVKLTYSEELCAITWVIPDFNEGGGGHLNIFRMIKNLEDLGAPTQQVLIIGNHSKKSREEAESSARKYFFPTKAKIYLQTDSLPRTEAMVATCWQTAYFVKEQPESVRKFYFVQDFEPLFYPAGSNSLLAANTYRFGFGTITAGNWLRDILQRDYAANAVCYGFSYDRHLYHPPTVQPETFEHDIFFYARPFTERRMFDLGVAAISRAIEVSGRPLRIAFAGSNLPQDCAPFPFTNLGVLSLSELAHLYGKINCALVLSATNASLLPYELMACGCPVITNQGPNNEWLFPAGYGGVAPNTPDELGELLSQVINKPERRHALSLEGIKIVEPTDWLAGARTMLEFIRKEGVQ
ncbi:MAG: glycosyltransferase [Verrucomicrobiota bacterium]